VYNAYFGLRERPFPVTSDPSFLYPGAPHQGALAHLLATSRAREALIALTGEPGTGKTTLLRRVIQDLKAAGVRVLSCHVAETFDEMTTSLCQYLGILVAGDTPQCLDKLKAYLAVEDTTGDLVAVAIDEAQLLSPDVLTSLHALTQLGSSRDRRLQILLAGNAELEATLERLTTRHGPGFATRVTLAPLSTEEVGPYVQWRLRRAGAERGDLFSPEALERVAVYAQGLPRLIGQICDAALTLAYESRETTVSAASVDEAAGVLDLVSPQASGKPEAQAASIEATQRETKREPRWSAGVVRRLRTTLIPRVGWAELGLVCLCLFLGTQAAHPRLTTAPGLVPPRVARTGSEPPVVSIQPLAPPTLGEPGERAAAVAPTALSPTAEGSAPRAVVVAPLQDRVKRERGTPTRQAASRPSPATAAPPLSPEERALLNSAEAGNLEAVRAWLGAHVSPNPRDENGLTPLMVATIHGHATIVRTLLNRGASVNARDRAGATPLMMAANNNRSALLELLLERGADVNARTDAGWTALMYATWQGHVDVVRLLLHMGADATVTDRRGWTALMYARWRTAHPLRTGPAPEDQPGGSAPRDEPPPGASRRGYEELIALLGQVADRSYASSGTSNRPGDAHDQRERTERRAAIKRPR
jgi:general secretion pathway protein A